MIKKSIFKSALTPKPKIANVYEITPENEFCLNCKRKKCNGNCKDYQDFKKGKKHKH